MLPQIITADGGAAERCKVSLGHYRVMLRCDLGNVADFKAVICDCDYRRSCRERLRDTKSSIFFHHMSTVSIETILLPIECQHLHSGRNIHVSDSYKT